MTVSEAPGTLKHFRRTPWRFQRTFITPLKNLRPFVATIVSAHAPLQAARLTLDQVVFEPKHLIALLTRYSLPPLYNHGWTLAANCQREVEELLEAALSDWLDFAFVPTPKPFVMYADHDEFTTFFANTKSNLNRVVKELAAQGFEDVPDYKRNLLS